MSDGPRGDEGGSGGTEEAGTFQTRGDSAQDANRLCRLLVRTDFMTTDWLIDLMKKYNTLLTTYFSDKWMMLL